MTQPARDNKDNADFQVALFVPAADVADRLRAARVPVRTFGSYLEFRQHRTEVRCIVVGTRRREVACKLLKSLRADPAAALVPTFSLFDHGPEVMVLCDGIVGDVDQAWTKALAIAERLGELDGRALDVPENGPYRLLAYLYSRPDHLVEPVVDWKRPGYYAYPLVEALCSGSNAEKALESLVERRLLSPVSLVDRVRHCPKCDGAHLNFVDACPACRGIDIHQRPFLHCFACGHVAPDDQFVTESGLVCPNCRARLRHIGTDYDRPLENFHCRGCEEVFVEPEVQVRCMHCGGVHAPGQLVPRNRHRLQLTERGRVHTRTGTVEDAFALLDGLNNVEMAYFVSIVDWLLSLGRRHKDEQFGLMGIRIRNVEELADRLGRHRLRDLLDAFAGRVREFIRATDLTTRTNRYTLWLLLPKTPAEGIEVVRRRIVGLGKEAAVRELELATVVFHAPSQVVEGEKARQLMARLEGQVME